MDDGELHVVVEGEDGDASSSTDNIAQADRLAAKYRADAAAANRKTAAYNIEAARLKVDSDMLTTESEARAAESQYREAREVGDIDAETKAQRRLAAAEARRTLLENQAEHIARTPVRSGDNFEDHLSQFTSRTADWMRDHRDWVEDPKKNSKLIGAHNFAIAEGLTPDTDEYFSHVEKMIGLRSGGGSSRSGSMRSGSSDINPNDVNTHVRDGGKSVYLTPGERKTATDGTLTWATGPNKGKPLGLQEFSRRKAAMIASGGYYDKI
jgi:hypothetical protein